MHGTAGLGRVVRLRHRATGVARQQCRQGGTAEAGTGPRQETPTIEQRRWHRGLLPEVGEIEHGKSERVVADFRRGLVQDEEAELEREEEGASVEDIRAYLRAINEE